MSKKLSGNLMEWDDAKGFGFLQCGSTRVFVHRREFTGRRKGIEKGDRLRFLIGQDDKGRTCAKSIEQLGHGGKFSFGAIAAGLALLILPAVALERLFSSWLWVGAYLVGINGLTAVFYWLDKWKARQGAWRISEANLHLFELLGGWPAGFFWQRLLRHKIAKWSYQMVFWMIVLAYQFAALEVLSGGRISRGVWSQFIQGIQK